MIYLTGDIHGDLSIRKLGAKSWPEGRELTREDYVIILGDFGLVWDGSDNDEYWLDWLEGRPWTTLFVDGNHENHRMLAEYPEEDWCGGAVHRIRPHVLHLMRGYIFDIDGNSFLAMGGGKSHDIPYRKEGVSWWPEEIPSDEEMLRCEDSLDYAGWSVDYILTHDVPATVVPSLAYRVGRRPDIDPFEEWLDTIASRTEYKRWYCGHWHIEAIHERLNVEVLYNYIVELGE